MPDVERPISYLLRSPAGGERAGTIRPGLADLEAVIDTLLSAGPPGTLLALLDPSGTEIERWMKTPNGIERCWARGHHRPEPTGES